VQIDEFQIDQLDAFVLDLTKNVLSGLGHSGGALWEKESEPGLGTARRDRTQRPAPHYVAVGTKTCRNPGLVLPALPFASLGDRPA
jgi:hypothetical protein